MLKEFELASIGTGKVQNCFHNVFKQMLGTLSNEDGNADDDGSEKIYFCFSLYFFLRVIRVLFSSPYTL